MQLFPVSSFLRWVLLADAATCIATGLLMTFGAELLEQFLGLPPELLRYAGIGLLPFAAFIVYLATRENLSTPTIWAVIVLNALWTADSFLLLLSGWIEPTRSVISLSSFRLSAWRCLPLWNTSVCVNQPQLRFDKEKNKEKNLCHLSKQKTKRNYFIKIGEQGNQSFSFTAGRSARTRGNTR